jgi:exodeoxyribonuclease-5
LLDFDDLILAARALLRDHEAVRQALGARYRYLLVDEFQDTDPLQTEILWRLCGDPRGGTTSQDWNDYVIRPGALFLVGDPKQAIYRFRGADIAAYTQARAAFEAHDPASVLSISTNFRSRAPILAYVNQCFKQRLNEPGQSGFIALDAFRHGDEEMPAVMALDVAINAEAGQGGTEVARNAEAEAVAALCLQLIGQHKVPDRRSGMLRDCRPGDIALLAPMGTELWRYEAALERRGIPVASQAGKGFYRRQEVQDLIALTRVLADSSDTIAFGALLRGPLIGLSEEELLDVVWRLPRDAASPQKLPRLDLNVDPLHIAHPLAREVLGKLQALRRLRNGTTPHLLLSQALDAFQVRAILVQRHQGQAERALANVDQYLAMSRHYAVQGMVAFATAMSTAWEDEARAVEGQPDVQEDAVTLFTVHAAKGLEWPVVIPVNMMTKTMAAESIFIDRSSGQFQCRLFGATPGGYMAARQLEDEELGRERIRLWYVALTRARDLLVLPRPDANAAPSTWAGLLDLALQDLPCLTVVENRPRAAAMQRAANGQSQEEFAGQTSAIHHRQAHVSWRTPSRDEGLLGEVQVLETPEDRIEGEAMAVASQPLVQGGRTRGLIIHKLLEEVLSGETGDALAALQMRAGELITELGEVAHDDARDGLAATELAQCVQGTLALPEIVSLRPSLWPEFHVYGGDGVESAVIGIADAVSRGPDGEPQVVVDWKSDVDPSPAMLAHYRDQVSCYMKMTGTARGLIVLVTSGKVIEVVAAP